jgi:hypothetical protein
VPILILEKYGFPVVTIPQAISLFSAKKRDSRLTILGCVAFLLLIKLLFTNNFSARLTTGDVKTVFARTSFLGFLRHNDLGAGNG